MNSAEELIEEITRISAGKVSNDELMIYRHEEGQWTAEIGNPLTCVLIGEGPSEFSGDGSSMRSALRSLYEKLVNASLA